MTQNWVRKPHCDSMTGYLNEVWSSRRLFQFFVRHSVNRVYSAAILGIGWLFIRPLIMALVASFVFRSVLGLSTAPVPYLLFVLTSLSIWLMFQRAMMWGTKSVQRNRRIFQRFYFPRFICHIASITPSLIEAGVVLCTAIIAAIYFWWAGIYTVDLGWHSLAAFLAIGLTLLLVIGVTSVTTILNNIARDVWYTSRYLLTALSLITPVYYPRSAVRAPWGEYMLLNPMTPIVELYRWALLHDEPMRWDALALSAVVIIGLLMIGLLFFIRFEARSIDAV
jgi:lipopolysaccharide transport system permease protein